MIITFQILAFQILAFRSNYNHPVKSNYNHPVESVKLQSNEKKVKSIFTLQIQHDIYNVLSSKLPKFPL